MLERHLTEHHDSKIWFIFPPRLVTFPGYLICVFLLRHSMGLDIGVDDEEPAVRRTSPMVQNSFQIVTMRWSKFLASGQAAMHSIYYVSVSRHPCRRSLSPGYQLRFAYSGYLVIRGWTLEHGQLELTCHPLIYFPSNFFGSVDFCLTCSSLPF